VNPAHDHLVTRLEAMRAALDTADAEAVAALVDDAVADFARTPAPFDDPRVLALFQDCQEKANRLLSHLHVSMDSHATSRRAASAYGGQP
jgi:hypothetical protein